MRAMTDGEILSYAMTVLKTHVEDKLPMSPAGARRLLVDLEELRAERREKPVSATQ